MSPVGGDTNRGGEPWVVSPAPTVNMVLSQIENALNNLNH